MTDLKILGLIPARGGSKRLPRKNVLPLNGKPLIQWSIEAAINVDCLTRVAVSSDDAEVLKIARENGADAIIRPAELASDVATSASVVQHALNDYAARGEQFDAVMLLQPTSPLRTADDIRSAVEQFQQTGAACVLSVSPVEHSPLLVTTFGPDGNLDKLVDTLHAQSSLRSQDMAVHYRLNGAIYLVTTQAFQRSGSLFSKPSAAYVMPSERSFDIDTRHDFMACENAMQANERH